MSRRELFASKAALVIPVLTLAVVAAGCTGDMYDQHRLKPMRASDHWADGRSVRDPVPNTVARRPPGQPLRDDHFFTGKVKGALVDTLPYAVDRRMLERGQDRFLIYCTPCHGLDGEGKGTVVRRGMRQPPSYHIERLRQAPIGHYFDVMTKGFGVMYDFSYQLSPRDRWAVAAYIRALQLSQHAKLADLPWPEQQKLEAAP